MDPIDRSSVPDMSLNPSPKPKGPHASSGKAEVKIAEILVDLKAPSQQSIEKKKILDQKYYAVRDQLLLKYRLPIENSVVKFVKACIKFLSTIFTSSEINQLQKQKEKLEKEKANIEQFDKFLEEEYHAKVAFYGNKPGYLTTLEKKLQEGAILLSVINPEIENLNSLISGFRNSKPEQMKATLLNQKAELKQELTNLKNLYSMPIEEKEKRVKEIEAKIEDLEVERKKVVKDFKALRKQKEIPQQEIDEFNDQVDRQFDVKLVAFQAEINKLEKQFRMTDMEKEMRLKQIEDMIEQNDRQLKELK